MYSFKSISDGILRQVNNFGRWNISVVALTKLTQSFRTIRTEYCIPLQSHFKLFFIFFSIRLHTIDRSFYLTVRDGIQSLDTLFNPDIKANLYKDSTQLFPLRRQLTFPRWKYLPGIAILIKFSRVEILYYIK